MNPKLPTFDRLDFLIDGASTAHLKEETPKFESGRPRILDSFSSIITENTSASNTDINSPNTGNCSILK